MSRAVKIKAWYGDCGEMNIRRPFTMRLIHISRPDTSNTWRRKMKKILLPIILVIVIFPGISQGVSDLFYPYVVFPTGSWPEAAAIGDVNGDARNDVVMTTSFGPDRDNDHRLFVFLQNASGELDPPMKYPAGNGDSVDIGDLNNDGRKDVVVTASNAVGVFYQNDTGGLDPMVTYPSGHTSFSNAYKVRIGDFNNDGLLDVVSIDWGGQSMAVEVFLQNQEGTLDLPVAYTVTHDGYDDLDVGDVNHDGLTDIIVMSGQGLSPNIGLLLQQPDGSLGSPVYYDLDIGELTNGVAVGDVNGDTRQDIVVTYGGNRPDSKIGVFPQNDSGTLNPATSYDSYDIPGAVVISDANGDGTQDIILTHGGFEALGVYLQGSGGALMPEQLYPLSSPSYNPHCLAAGDINGDGFTDVVVAHYDYGLVVFYNSQGPAIPNIDVSPHQVNFGTVFWGDQTSETVTIYNQGTGDLTINSVTITGPDAAAFSQTDDCSTVLPGGYCTITATFIPTSEGKKAAVLTILSNDFDEPSVSVSFSGYAGIPQFYPYLTFRTGSHSEAVAIGDVNGDGRNDVVVTTSFSFDSDDNYRLIVFLQNASGQLDPPIKYLTSGTYDESPLTVGIGDVNNDGRDDVVVGNAGKNIDVFLQNHSGGLDVPAAYPTTDSRCIKIADLNNDGLLDVAGIGWPADSASVFLQNTNGTLDPPITYTVNTGGWGDLDIGDVNHDGLTDVILNGIGVLLQRADGSLGPPVYYHLGVDEFTKGVAVGDVNGDTWQDVVVTYGGNRPDSKIGVFLQNSSGTLEPAVSYDSYDIPEPAEIGDVNGDGRQDIITAHGGWKALGVYVQYTDGSLMPEQLYPLPYASHYNPHGMAIGDINGDGHNDVVLTGFGLVVLYHREDKPNISISPEQLLFGATPVGQSTRETLTISNTSIVNLAIGSLSFSGTDASQFTKENDTCSSQTLSPVSSCSVDVAFSPTAKGDRTAMLTVSSDDPDTPTIDVPIQVYWKLKLLTPNGGETIPSGSTYTIQWVAPSTAVRFKVSYSLDNGVTWRPIQRWIWLSRTSLDWILPEPTGNKKKCLIKVTGFNAADKVVGEDKSDTTFSVEVVNVTSPREGETLISGTRPTIFWTTNGTRSAVKDARLYYTKNAGATWTPIGIDSTNSGNYNGWTVPDVASAKDKCKIKVVLRNEKGVTVGSGVSDGFFTISPP
jgi:hypothetical protein